MNFLNRKLPETIQDLANAERIVATKTCLAYDVVRVPTTMVHGVAGDEDLIFTAFNVNIPGAPPPQGPAVVAYRRNGGDFVANLPAPAGGFILPFTMRCPAPGKLYMLDAGGFPTNEMVTVPPIITEYNYTYNKGSGAFTATVVRSIALPTILPGNPVPFGFVADFEVLPNGDVLFIEQIIGALYIWKTDGSVQMVVGPASADPSAAIPQMKSDYFPANTVFTMPEIPFPRPFAFLNDYSPGANYLAVRNGLAYWFHEVTQTVYRIPVSALYDNRTPSERASSIQSVWTYSDIPTGRKIIVAGLTFNQFDPSSPWLYMTAFTQSRIIRINVDNPAPAAEEVIADSRLFQGPVSVAFAKPKNGSDDAVMLVCSDQEYELPGINPFVIPIGTNLPEFSTWYISKVLINNP